MRDVLVGLYALGFVVGLLRARYYWFREKRGGLWQEIAANNKATDRVVRAALWPLWLVGAGLMYLVDAVLAPKERP